MHERILGIPVRVDPAMPRDQIILEAQTRQASLTLHGVADTALRDLLAERDDLREENARLKRMVEHGFQTPTPSETTARIRELQVALRDRCPACLRHAVCHDNAPDHAGCPLTDIERRVLLLSPWT